MTLTSLMRTVMEMSVPKIQSCLHLHLPNEAGQALPDQEAPTRNLDRAALKRTARDPAAPMLPVVLVLGDKTHSSLASQRLSLGGTG